MVLSLFLSLLVCFLWPVEGQLPGSVRLVTKNEQTASTLTAGRLEVYYNGQWGTVCSSGFSTFEANAACRQLGFSSGQIRSGTVGSSGLGFDAASSSTPIWLDNLSCPSSATSLRQCTSNGIGVHNCVHSDDVALSCLGNGALRLSNSFTFSAGRVEVYYNGQWGTVCDDFFGQTDANVACRQLGYESAFSYGSNIGYGSGTGRIWLDDLQCTSSDVMLSTCQHRGFGIENCFHSQDVAVSCSSTSIDLGGLAGGIIAAIVIAILVPFICIVVCIIIVCVAVCTGACCAAGASNRRSRNIATTTAVQPTTTATVVTAAGTTSAYQPAPYQPGPPQYTDSKAPYNYPQQQAAYPPQAGTGAPPPQPYPGQKPPGQVELQQYQPYPSNPAAYPPQGTAAPYPTGAPTGQPQPTN